MGQIGHDWDMVACLYLSIVFYLLLCPSLDFVSDINYYQLAPARSDLFVSGLVSIKVCWQ